MSDNNQNYLTKAALRILRPLVRILLRNGIAYGNFAELVRKTYVDVAFEVAEEEGRKATISSVSGATGLTRKETKRLREIQSPESSTADQKYNRVVRVISGWHNDEQFKEKSGEPRVLSLSDGTNNFSDLVKKYSGDIPTSAMLSVLRDADCVEIQNDTVKLLVSAYIPGNDPVDKINILGVDTAELLDTIDHNLTAPSEQLRYQRKVSNHNLNLEHLEDFRQLSARKAQKLLEDLDAWLSRHEAAEGSENAYVALGIYYTEQKEEKE